MDVWLLVAISVAVVLVSVLWLRLHAFLTLMLAGWLVAALGAGSALERYTDFQIQRGKMTPQQAASLRDQSAAERLTVAFGETAGKIGVLIALASIIGQCLMESRAATVIVDSLLRWTGPRRAPEALAVSSFVLGIPVFFDTVFYLMVPLARSLRQRLGQDYVLFLLAIMAGGSIAHSLVPPTPGPLLVAKMVGVEMGTMMVAGLAIGSCSSVLSLMVARWINSRIDVPLRFPSAEDNQPTVEPIAGETDGRDPAGAPSLLQSLSPIVVPVILIAIGSLVSYQDAGPGSEPSRVAQILSAAGDNLVALAVGVALALSLLRYCPAGKRASLIGRALESAGNIVLITAAGGAFGTMLRQAGIEEAVGALAHGVPGLLLLPLAFLVTAAIRTLQGSATVAMITAAGVLQGLAQSESLPFHPVYLAMAIGAGSKPICWMTDSGFWVITRMSGMNEAEGLRVVSPMSIAMGLNALFFTMLFAAVYPAP